jgi:hypothetical protein
MRDRGIIVGGLMLFLGVITFPVWYNLAAGSTAQAPDLALPEKEKPCVAPVEYMRTSHMELLITWRDEVVREQNRKFVAFDGRTHAISLTQTCLRCHARKADFCDRCHAYAGVSPLCWDCHIDPKLVPLTSASPPGGEGRVRGSAAISSFRFQIAD